MIIGPTGESDLVFRTHAQTALTIDGSTRAATFAGDVQAPGIYVGSTNTSYDFYNNGTSYLNGATTVDDNLTVNGNIIVTGTVDGVDIAARDSVLTSTTTTADAALPKAGGTMTGHLRLNDDVQLQIGSSNDAYILHNGSNTYFVNGVGDLEITNDTDDGDIILNDRDWETNNL